MKTLSVVVAVGFLLQPAAALRAQGGTAGIAVSAAFLEAPSPGAPIGLWIQVRNTGQATRILCHESVSYAFVSSGRGAPPGGAWSGSSECATQTAGHSLLILLAGQSAFLSHAVNSPLDPGAELRVVVRLLDAHDRIPVMLTWRGSVTDAIANGDKLKAGAFASLPPS
jgi:hypothetical protein